MMNEATSDDELEPLKKYLLLQKLESLKNKLELNDAESEGLTTFLQFGKNFSYETVLSVSNSFATFFEKQLTKGEENNAQ